MNILAASSGEITRKLLLHEVVKKAIKWFTQRSQKEYAKLANSWTYVAYSLSLCVKQTFETALYRFTC
jgi:hypothetical protein